MPRGKTFDSVSATIGDTPMVRINRLIPAGQATVFAKCEFFQPLNSVKDRIGVAMIEAGERDGKVKPHTHIIEPTSGNTGIALAFVCASKGYKLTLTMPESMSVERRALLARHGRQCRADAGRRRHEGRHRQGQRADRPDAQLLDAATIRQSRQSCHSRGDHGPGNLGRQRPQHRRHRGGRGNRRHDHGSGPRIFGARSPTSRSSPSSRSPRPSSAAASRARTRSRAWRRASSPRTSTPRS